MDQLVTKPESLGASDAEIDWMLQHRPLEHDPAKLVKDYGQEDAALIIKTFTESPFAEFLPVCNYPGVGSRWEAFFKWLSSLPTKPASLRDAFKGFSCVLGRVTSYRALSLTSPQYEKIRSDDSIYPTGRLKAPEDQVNAMVEKYGVVYIAVARLYIGRRMVELDPSLSLHDDAETAVTIAGGYLDEERKVYIFGIDIPKIEHLGFLLSDIQEDDKIWFGHNGVYFNSTWERTERYCLWEIPFLSTRLKTLRILNNREELIQFIEPFKQEMKRCKDLSDQGKKYTYNPPGQK